MKRIDIEWKGEAFSVLENEAFALGERLEEIVTLAELANMSSHPKFRKLARCYAEILNFAGAHVTPELIHTEMMNEIKGLGGEAKAEVITAVISTLVEILMDGAPEDGEADEGKKEKSSSKTAT